MTSYEWLCPSVCTDVNFEMRLLVEAFVASRHVALIPFPWFLAGLDDFFVLHSD